MFAIDSQAIRFVQERAKSISIRFRFEPAIGG
jgi:hypothetical protein